MIVVLAQLCNRRDVIHHILIERKIITLVPSNTGLIVLYIVHIFVISISAIFVNYFMTLFS